MRAGSVCRKCHSSLILVQRAIGLFECSGSSEAVKDRYGHSFTSDDRLIPVWEKCNSTLGKRLDFKII